MESIPQLGLGFWLIEQKDAKRVTLEGFKDGYRHIDTAYVYGNEKEIGDALQECNLKREDYWITSKVPAEFKSYEQAKQAIQDSLARLRCGYLDLMLIHCPVPWKEFENRTSNYYKENLEMWRAMVEAKKAGLIKNIGVSNFEIDDIKNIQEHSDEPIYANQIRIHIGHVPTKVIEYCKDNGILVEAYSPIATGKLIGNQDIQKIADKYEVSLSQLCIQYCMQKDLITLPRSKSNEHIKENTQLDFVISEEGMAELDRIKIN